MFWGTVWFIAIFSETDEMLDKSIPPINISEYLFLKNCVKGWRIFLFSLVKFKKYTPIAMTAMPKTPVNLIFSDKNNTDIKYSVTGAVAAKG